MNWIPLRKYHVHLVDKEVTKVIERHHNLRESILEGDVLSIEKMSQLELSIKQRIQQIDEFYNQNCLDQRVKFLQGPRMKLWRLMNNSIINEKDKEFTVNLPWKRTNEASDSRNVPNSSRLSVTPRKNELINSQTIKNSSKNDTSKSPLMRSNNEKPSIQNKPKITLQIPDDTLHENNNYTFSHSQSKKVQGNQPRTGRKTQYIPQRVPVTHGNNFQSNQEPTQRSNNKSRAHQASGPNLVSSRSKLTNVSGKSRTLTESNNANSMKKLNDLIFTIKMTKQEYQDFMDMKKNLDRQDR